MPESDVSLVLTKLSNLIGGYDTNRLIVFTHQGQPVTKSRARWSQKTGRFYVDEKTRSAQDSLAWAFKEASREKSIEGGVAIVCIFYRPNYQRIDIDNLTKLVMDAATQAHVWKDDCFVISQASFVELDINNPRTVIALSPIETSFDRTRHFICKICGIRFSRSGTATFKKPPLFCSRKCRYVAYKKDRTEARCPKCETIFMRKIARQRYCSKACSSRENIVRAQAANQRPWPKCTLCGQRVSRREYLLCCNCRQKGRKLGSKNKTWKGIPIIKTDGIPVERAEIEVTI